ncbi:hypothetical protein HI914_05566 [Erysiphe necator]|uniref:Putative ydr124wp-like protein n=1 Tax=Uncinula necator TaxID=52586 RepID=A0A0B1PCG9_UNCNE|nr:hypothetical protein HI914_05566 [Erysiphe necator]KHJ35060.1 putative ydr124wp-like protein [Erysiphe necator]
MVQNVPLPRDDDCWGRNEKSFDVSQDVVAAESHSTIPNLNRNNVRSQSMSDYQPHIDPNEQQSTAIKSALLNCGHDVAEFILIYTGSDGNPHPTVISSSGLRNYSHRIANEHVCYNFTRSILHSRNDMVLVSPDDPRSISQFDTESRIQSPWDQKLISPSDYRVGTEDSDEDRSPRSRKRARARARVRRLRQGLTEDQPLSSVKSQKLTIGNEADVDRFYYIRFKDMQQSSCKVMGKAFVKLVEPRKQTHHPYTGGNEKAPSWWPPTKGDNAVRHKEPDHLLKPERISLLVHILKMIIEPAERQNPTIRKLGLNVKKLEETTMEVMSNWFNDKEHPENLLKKKYLKEIFRVAKIQERYKRGEIDGATAVSITCGIENYGQDGSDEEEDNSFIPNSEVDSSEALHSIAITGVHSPESILTHPSLQQSDNEIRLPSQGLRQNLQRSSIHTSTYDSQLFRLDPTSFQTPQPRIPNLHDPTRRSYTQSGFGSPQSSLTSPWPATPLINSPPQNSIFFSQPTNSFTYLSSPQQQHHIHSTHHGLEGLHIGNLTSNRSFDTGNTFNCQQPQRTGNLSPPLTYPPQTHPHVPYSYNQGTSMYAHENDIKPEQ